MKLRVPTIALAILLVSAPEAHVQEASEESATEVHTYPVHDLVRRPEDNARPFGPLGELVLGDEHGPFGPPGRNEEGIPIAFGVEEDDPVKATDELASTVGAHLEYLGVDEPELEALAGSVRATLSPAGHTLLRGTLAAIRRVSRPTIVIECALVSPTEWRRLAPAKTEAGTSFAPEVFEKALLTPGAALVRFEATSSQEVSGGTVLHEPVIDDYEINCTGVVPDLNPVLGRAESGVRVWAHALLADDRERVFLDLVVGKHTAKSSVTHDLEGGYGKVELPVQRDGLVSTSLVCDGRRPRLAGIVGGPDGVAVLVRAHRLATAGDNRSSEPVTVVGGGKQFRVYPVGLLFGEERHPPWPIGIGRQRGDFHGFVTGDGSFGRSLWTKNRLVETLGERFDESTEYFVSSFGEAAIELTATNEVHEFVASLVRTETAALCRAATLDVEQLELPLDLYVEWSRTTAGGAVLPDDWDAPLADRGGVERTSHTLVGVAGRTQAIHDALTESFVTDSERVSGGTGFSMIDMVDPVTSHAGSGVQMRALLDLDIAEGRAHLWLDGALTRITDRRKFAVSYPLTEGVSTESDRGSLHVTTGGVLYFPAQEVTPWQVDRSLPLNRWTILQAESTPAGKVRVLVSRVRAGE